MAEIEQRPRDAKRDLAGYESWATGANFQLWIGGTPVVTDSAPAAADIQKYQLCARLPDDTIVPFVPGTHTAAMAVLSAQPSLTGQACPYWNAGRFNHEAIIWPAGAAFDTYTERKALLSGPGCLLMVGHLI